MGGQREDTVARYPRVVIERRIVTAASADPDIGVILREHFKQADDGPFYVHLLNQLTIIGTLASKLAPGTDPQTDREVEFFREVGRTLQRRLEESVDDPRHFEKVRWFARYWNDTLPRGTDRFEPIQGPGLERGAEWA